VVGRPDPQIVGRASQMFEEGESPGNLRVRL
jgi:hypothetical protein